MPIQLNLNVGDLASPTPRTSRAPKAAGQGFQELGKALSNSATALSKLADEEDDLVAMDFTLRYGRDLNSVIDEKLAAEPDVKKHAKLIHETEKAITDAYTNAVRKAGVPNGFAARALPQVIAIKNKKLGQVSQKLNGMALGNIEKSEQMALSSMVDEETGRIATVQSQVFPPDSLERGVTQTIKLLDEPEMSAKVRNHFESIIANQRYLPDNVHPNQLINKFGESLIDTILTSVARNHTEIFTDSQFGGAKIAIEVPFIDNDGNFTTKTVRPTPEQLLVMTKEAESQASHDAALEKSNNLELAKKQAEADSKTITSVLRVANNPQTSPRELSKLYQHLLGNTHDYQPDTQGDGSVNFNKTFKFHEDKNRRTALDRVQQSMLRGGTPRFNNPVVIDKFRNKIFAEQQPTEDDMYELSLNTTEEKYGELWNLARGLKSTKATEIGKVKDEVRSSIRRLLGAVPGPYFKVSAGVVADKVEQDFISRIQRLEASQKTPLTSDQIWVTRLDALETTFDFLATNSDLDAESLSVLSAYEDIETAKDGIVTPAEQIKNLYLRGILDFKGYRDALFYANMKERVLSVRSNQPSITSAVPGETDQMKKLRKLQLEGN